MTTSTTPLSIPSGPPPVTIHPLSLFRYWQRMRREPVGRVLERFERYGDLYRARTLGYETYVLRHPRHIQDVLVTNAGAFGKPTHGPTARRLRQLLGEGLLNSNGELWRRQRRLVQPAFSRERLAAYASLVVAHSQKQLDGLRDGARIDVSREAMELTLRIVAHALFEHRVEDDADRVVAALRAFRRGFRSADVVLPDWVPTLPKLRTGRALRELSTVIDTLIESPPARDGRDLLSLMKTSAHAEDAGTPIVMGREQLRDELLTLFVAGHETTAHALSWTWHLLSTDAGVEARMLDEIDHVLRGRSPCWSDLERLEYTQQVLCEAMRLFPPAYVIARVATVDTRIGEYATPRGTNVLVWIYHAHHDPRWFPEPERFDPTRFSPQRRRQIPACAYLPFGAGSRTCIGKSFAMMEAMLILACTAQRFRLERTGGSRVARDMALTLAPRGLVLRVRARTAATASWSARG